MTIIVEPGDALTVALAYLVTMVSLIGAAHLAMQSLMETILNEIEGHHAELQVIRREDQSLETISRK